MIRIGSRRFDVVDEVLPASTPAWELAAEAAEVEAAGPLPSATLDIEPLRRPRRSVGPRLLVAGALVAMTLVVASVVLAPHERREAVSQQAQRAPADATAERTTAVPPRAAVVAAAPDAKPLEPAPVRTAKRTATRPKRKPATHRHATPRRKPRAKARTRTPTRSPARPAAATPAPQPVAPTPTSTPAPRRTNPKPTSKPAPRKRPAPAVDFELSVEQ